MAFEVWAKDAIDNDRLVVIVPRQHAAERLADRLVNDLGFTTKAWVEEE